MGSFDTIAQALTGALAGGAALGAVSAGSAAATGAIGTAIMRINNPDYNVLQQSQMMASGSALLNGALGLSFGAAWGASKKDKALFAKTTAGDVFCFGLSYHLLSQFFSALIGHGIFLEARQYNPSTQPLMTLEQSFITTAIGTPISFVIFLGIVGCYLAVFGKSLDSLISKMKSAEASEPTGREVGCFLNASRAVTGGLVGGVGVGALGAMSGALTSAIGSGFLGTGITKNIVERSASGGALLNGSMGMFWGIFIPLLHINTSALPNRDYNKLFLLAIAWHLLSQPLNAILGHGLFLEAGDAVASLGQTVASAAVGEPFTLGISVFLLLVASACNIDFFAKVFTPWCCADNDEPRTSSSSCCV